jgi:hypothetical protein
MRTRIVLLGAELPGLDVHANYERTNELRADLLKLGLSFVGVSNVTATKKSHLFIVNDGDEASLATLAKKYGQKAILVSDEGRNTEVVSTKSTGRTALGKLVAAGKEEAKKAKFYLTFIEEGREHFYITKKGEKLETASNK